MNKKLIFTNEIPSQFSDCQEYIKETIENFFNALDLECELKIKFIDFASVNEYEETDCALINISKKKHELLITNSVLKTIHIDRSAFFNLAIYHEFEHIRDYCNMMRTKLFKFNLCLTNQKNFERAYISTGFLFWTEIYAYYKTLEFSQKETLYFEAIPFGNLVKNYRKTVDLNKSLYFKQNLSFDEAKKYVASVDSFIYLCAKYMASSYAHHSRIPYSKIDKDKDYKKVFSILCELELKIKRLLNNPYGPKSYDDLLKLGKYICEKLRWKKFKVGLTKKDGKICKLQFISLIARFFLFPQS